MKTKAKAYLLWFFLGLFSAHRFYLEKHKSAVFYLLTLQLFGIGWILDLFFIGEMVDRYNLKRGYYGPINGLDQAIVVNLNSSEKPSQSSSIEKNVAS